MDATTFYKFIRAAQWRNSDLYSSTIKIKNLRDAKLLKMKACMYILINFHSQAGQNMMNKIELSNLETNFVMLQLE